MELDTKIMKKIKNLLLLAESGANDEESQTALLMAQKLMLKYKISRNELSDEENTIVTKSLSIYKRLYWWEKLLAQVVADNFRVLLYVQSHRLPHHQSLQRKIVYMGYPEDVDLAYRVFHSAFAAMKYHVKKDASHYSEMDKRTYRTAYYQGFIDGLSFKFKEQRDEMMQEDEKYALILKVPTEVQEAFNEQVTGKVSMKVEVFDDTVQAYQEGFQKGKQTEWDQYYIDGR